MEHIDRKLERQLVISELRAMNSLSGLEFTAQFCKAAGFPPKQYISIRRISKEKTSAPDSRFYKGDRHAHRSKMNSSFSVFSKIYRFYSHAVSGEKSSGTCRKDNLADVFTGIP